jgi:hypothetical protein
VRQRGQAAAGRSQRERHPRRTPPRQVSKPQPHAAKTAVFPTPRRASEPNAAPASRTRAKEAPTSPKPPRSWPAPAEDRSTVRTNIPGLMQPSHRRGR